MVRYLQRPAMFVVAVFTASVAGFGCGKTQPPTYGSEDGKLIAQLVEELNEAKTDDGLFKKMFSGSPPKDRKKFDRFFFDVSGSPSVSGTSASARVKVSVDGSGAEKGIQDWTFVKEGNTWKIKTAPLP